MMPATREKSLGEHAGKSVSLWMAGTEIPDFGPLTHNEHADVCIVGAGIAGLTAAYLLGREGKTVIVLDDGPIAAGETERTSAHLCWALDDRFYELERLHGEKGARLAAESHAAAIDMIEMIVAEERIDCEFERVDGYLFVPRGEAAGHLDEELAAVLRTGMPGVEMVSRAPIESYDTGPAIRFPRQAQFHPLKYMAALAKAIVRDGGRICGQTHASRIEGGDSARVETKDGPVATARTIIVATNTPVNDMYAIHTKQAAYRTFAIGAIVPANSISKALYWDTADPYHYVRLQSLSDNKFGAIGDDMLIVGGEDHKTGQADDAESRYLRLEEWARMRFPMMGKIRYRWSGQVMEPVDGIAFIGRNPMDQGNVFVVTGDSGNGLTHGTIAAMIFADLIQGRENPWTALYDPARKTLGAIGRFAKETLNVAAQYADWVTPGEVKDETAIASGTGAVVRRGLKKIAIYRDPEGKLHEFSAACPHLGGVLAWNHSEKSWDCPCHGSRFDATGKVVNGPAISDLSPAEEQ